MINAAAILRGKVLIVDDKKADVMLLEQVLRKAGYSCVESTMKPREVCALHLKHRFDLILLDLQMQGMDGFQVMEELKRAETENYLPVFIITAHPDFKLRALQAGAKDFISKPYDLDEVLLRARNMLEVRLLHEEVRQHGKLLEALALVDPLTELANRRLLMEKMSMALAHARRNKSGMAVMYLDLDGFKQINDSFGHDVGDKLLKMVAKRLVDVVREEDTVARLGGDEFVIALWHVQGMEHVAKVAMKVVAAVAKPYVIDDHAVSITVSAGIGIFPDHGQDADTLLKHADLALYQAKDAGKNGFRVFPAEGRPAVADSSPVNPHD